MVIGKEEKTMISVILMLLVGYIAVGSFIALGFGVFMRLSRVKASQALGAVANLQIPDHAVRTHGSIRTHALHV
jgi:hypothetical protein